jgi:tRNA:m4X modification enzyme
MPGGRDAAAAAHGGGCGVYLKQKRRHCGWPLVEGTSVCRQHSCEGRVPCPLDDRHTVAVSELEAHLRRCSAGRQTAEAAQLAYVQPGLHDVPVAAEAEVQRAEAARLWRTHAASPEFAAACARVRSVAALVLAAVAQLPQPPPPPAALPGCVEAALQQAREEASLPHCADPFDERHAVQQAGILACMHAARLLPPPPGAVCVELGAGRGYLSMLLARASPGCSLLLVDRRSYRNKAERGLRREGSSEVRRIRCDVADLELDSAVGGADAIVIAKHLCGSATDLALRAAAGAGRLAGVAIAPCCHHSCTWERYVAADWCLALGIGSSEFAVVARLASWCTDSHGCAPAALPEAEAACSRWGLSASERSDIGQACKRLLDEGRARWLASRTGRPASVQAFVKSSISPENRLLVCGGA